LNDLLDSAFSPEPSKDQVRPDPLHRDSLSLSSGMRIDKGKLFAMTQPRAYQRLKPAAGLESIEPAQKRWRGCCAEEKTRAGTGRFRAAANRFTRRIATR
jgi:hypothetical protein